MEEKAPIVLFTYNRLNSLKNCINSLKKNEFCNESKIYIFSDGSKNYSDKSKIKNIRKYIKKIKGFKKKIIIQRKKILVYPKILLMELHMYLKKKKKQ